MTWWTDRLRDEEDQLYGLCTEFDTHLFRWLQRSDCADMITLRDYEEFRKDLPANAGAILHDSVSRALVYCFKRGCQESSKAVHAEICDEESELWNRLDGPVFRCNMLVNTTCEDTCDWHMIAEIPYDCREWTSLL